MTSSESSQEPTLSACGLSALPPHSTETGSLSLWGPPEGQRSRAPCPLHELARAAMTKFQTADGYNDRDVCSPSSGGRMSKVWAGRAVCMGGLVQFLPSLLVPCGDVCSTEASRSPSPGIDLEPRSALVIRLLTRTQSPWGRECPAPDSLTLT